MVSTLYGRAPERANLRNSPKVLIVFNLLSMRSLCTEKPSASGSYFFDKYSGSYFGLGRARTSIRMLYIPVELLFFIYLFLGRK